MTDRSGKRRTSAVSRLAALLILTGVAGCDNVEWGGAEFAVLPPPPRAEEPQSDLEAAERLPDGPILYYVRRDSLDTEVIPVAEIADDGMEPIRIGGDPETFGNRFISAFLREGAELTLFHRGRRAGTLIVDSAYVPTASVCRRLPRATGDFELARGAGGATEFLAMARTQAPDGFVLPRDTLAPDRRMTVMGPILAERALRARGAQLPNWRNATRQMFPFPVSDAPDLGFTATFLVDDELQVGNDDQGYSLFIVYTPQANGYDTAYVSHVNYPTAGKQAPRVIDFLDWDRDGSAELLLEVYGTTNSWFEAVGASDGDWERTLQDRCDTGGGAVAADTAGAAGQPATGAPASGQPPAGQGQPRQNQQAPQQPPGGGSPSGQQSRANTEPTTAALPLPDLEPVIRLAVPGRARPAPADTSEGTR